MLTVQNLRATTPGVQPASLLPGQLCFNVIDKLMFVGDGSNFKTSYEGTAVPGVPGEGWFSTPLSFDGNETYYIINPSYYGDIPVDGQVLAWDAALGRVVWKNDDPGVASTAYLTTSVEVAAAPGVDLSTKISNALGITPKEGDSVTVSGTSHEPFTGFYQFLSGVWVFAALHAPPLASEVPLNPILGLPASHVQAGIRETFNLAKQIEITANEALPRSGGTMTGDINFNNNQPVDAGLF